MIAFVIVVVVLGLWLGPLALIWSLNTLFALGIAYTFKTWAAALILGGMLTTSASRNK